MSYQFDEIGIELERIYTLYYGEISSCISFTSPLLCDTLNSIVSDMINACKNNKLKVLFGEKQLDNSLRTYNIPIENAKLELIYNERKP